MSIGRPAMREVVPEVRQWQSSGERVALATVVSVVGSAPRGLGATLAISEHGGISGSVSGGCVEPAVIEEGMQAIRTGKPRLLRFGITEEQNVEQIGLSCGGEIRVYVERLGDMTQLGEALANERPIARALLLADDQPSAALVIPETGAATGTLGDAALDAAAGPLARARLRRGDAGVERIRDATETERE